VAVDDEARDVVAGRVRSRTGADDQRVPSAHARFRRRPRRDFVTREQFAVDEHGDVVIRSPSATRISVAGA
jgi:hypothetical protein